LRPSPTGFRIPRGNGGRREILGFEVRGAWSFLYLKIPAVGSRLYNREALSSHSDRGCKLTLVCRVVDPHVRKTTGSSRFRNREENRFSEDSHSGEANRETPEVAWNEALAQVVGGQEALRSHRLRVAGRTLASRRAIPA